MRTLARYRLDRIKFVTHKRRGAGAYHLAGLVSPLHRLFHRAEGRKYLEGKEAADDDGGQPIEVEGDRADKEGHSLIRRLNGAVPFEKSCHINGPGGDRGYGAERAARRVELICEHLPRDFILVGYRPRDRPREERAEIIAEKDEQRDDPAEAVGDAAALNHLPPPFRHAADNVGTQVVGDHYPHHDLYHHDPDEVGIAQRRLEKLRQAKRRIIKSSDHHAGYTSNKQRKYGVLSFERQNQSNEYRY